MTAPNSPLFGLIDHFTGQYRGLSEKVIPTIQSELKKNQKPAVAVANAFKKHNVSQKIRKAIEEKVMVAATLGNGGIFANSKGVRSTLLNKRWPGQSLTLSGYLHRTSKMDDIVANIAGGMRRRKTFQEIAVRLQEKGLTRAEIPQYMNRLAKQSQFLEPTAPELRRLIKQTRSKINRLARGGAPTRALKAAYTEIVDNVERGLVKDLNQQVKIAVMEKARYNAARVARTEIARAHSLLHDYKADKDPDVVGVKYTLSSRHKIYDICDFHTNANLFGMGAGVYPKNNHPPHPFHPHCLCLPSDVFRGEAKKGNFNPEAGEKWLKKRSQKEKEMLFGKAGAKTFKKKTKDWNKTLNNYKGNAKPDLSGFKAKDVKPKPEFPVKPIPTFSPPKSPAPAFVPIPKPKPYPEPPKVVPPKNNPTPIPPKPEPNPIENPDEFPLGSVETRKKTFGRIGDAINAADFHFAPRVMAPQKTAINRYTGSWAFSLNSVLRSRGTIGDRGNWLKSETLLNHALENAPKYRGVTYRGIRFSNKGDFDNYMEGLTQNGIVADPAYFSTSTRQSMSQNWVSGYRYQVLMKVKGKDGGVAVKNLSIHGSEDEVLFNKNVDFKINKMEVTDTGRGSGRPGKRVEMELEEL